MLCKRFPEIWPDYIRQKLQGLESQITKESLQISKAAEELKKRFEAKVEVDRYEFQTRKVLHGGDENKRMRSEAEP